MSPRTLILHLLTLAPAVLVTLHFGSPWPAITNAAASAGATLAVLTLAVVLSFSRVDIDDPSMSDDATLKAVTREAFDAVWNLPTVTAVTLVKLWLVWMLSAPSYALELLTLVAIVSALNLAWIAVFGMPTGSKGRA